MVYQIPLDDPSIDLWAKVKIAELNSFIDVFDEVPVKVGIIAQRLNIKVISKTLDVGISGLIRKDGTAGYQIFINNTDYSMRQRFTVCHELAHFLLHRHHIDAGGITDTILYRSRLSSKLEVEANRLGAAILLPWARVISWHSEKFGSPPTTENIEAIADAFKASSLAVGFRLGI